MKWLVEIKYGVGSNSDLDCQREAMKFIPAFTLKHADESIRPNRFRTKVEYSSTKVWHYFTLIFEKEFPDFSEMILWVKEVENGLSAFFKEHKDCLNGWITRKGHRTYKLVTKRFLFWKRDVWVEY